jgi:ABC-2 type transport system permease protein
VRTLRKYAAVWWKLAQMAFLMQFANRWSSLGWLGGKVVRLGFFLVFIVAIFRHVPSVAGYSLSQVAVFFVTFNLVDIAAQLLFRGLYMVGRDIREGDLDFYLLHPVDPLFRMASNMVDFLDFLTLFPILGLAAYLLPKTLAAFAAGEAALRLALYLLLCANGVVIAFALHVLIASLTVRTQQMENTIWMYRDMMSLGRFPMDLYSRPIRFVLVSVLPVGIMVSFPSKALLGMLDPVNILWALALSAGLTALALWAWRGALRHYGSVSS